MLAHAILTWLKGLGLSGRLLSFSGDLLGFLALAAAAWLAHLLTKHVLLRVVSALVRRSGMVWDDVLLESGVFQRLSHLGPALVVAWLGEEFFVSGPRLLKRLDTAFAIYVVVIALMVLQSLVTSAVEIYHRMSTTRRVPLKGFAQGFMLVCYLLGLIVVLSIVLGRSPLYFLSGIGALTAILLLIFRDALLGFVAGIQISVNRMVQLGDPIEMPKYDANGEVVDVTLTTVKVRNWDKSVSTIPTYALISDPFKNWRGVNESGTRVVRRSIPLDIQSFRLVDDALFERLSRVASLRPYLESKRDEISAWNEEAGVDLSVPLNGRRMTNIGCFRAYALAYLRAHPRVKSDAPLSVRQLAPTNTGLPLEIHAFVTETPAATYDSIQADIFDHLLTLVPEFDLRVFQSPSGEDVRHLAGALPGASAAKPQPLPSA